MSTAPGAPGASHAILTLGLLRYRMASRRRIRTFVLLLSAALLVSVEASPAIYPEGWHVRETCAGRTCGRHALYLGADLVTRAETTWPSARKSADGWTCAGRERVTTRVLVASRDDAIGGGPPVCVPVAAFAR
jgi:hypothetical protein